MTPRPPLLTTSEVAEECRVDAETVRQWARQGRITAITLPGGHKRFRREDVDALLTPIEPTVGAA
jgi:DNA binding domain, excisionase family